MAGRFFNQRVKGSSTGFLKNLIIGGIFLILLVVSVIILLAINKDDSPDPIISMREKVTIEINSELPDKELFFSELQNVDADDINISFADADISKVGSYPIEITLYNENYSSILEVIDSQSPIITTKRVAINIGESYKAEDFIESCEDNSKEECKIEFYDLAKDQQGNLIDYSSYSEEGTYTIQIVAVDSSGNSTTPTNATLIIGNGEGELTTCNYGNSEYDSNAYILGINVAQNNCALDLNLYQNETTSKPAYDLAENDTKKLNKEINKLNLSDNVIEKNVKRLITPVLNTSGLGLVGYTVHIDLTLIYADGSEELVASYYIDLNGNRVYSTNKFNLD